ncbi:MAG TPA: SDR family NAD(P)-dependent oxidoreductase [Stellaceae bacterium]|nr:SDR family NAD(P)-dependent oxidoreductase [Stellaceae bacterium]
MKVIVLGATSAIAETAARLYAGEGSELLLAARHRERLDAIAADLRLRGAVRVETAVCDLSAAGAAAAFAAFVARLGGVDHVLLAYGILGDQQAGEQDLERAETTLQVNFTSAARWILAAAEMLQRQGHGSLVVLGSVAGDRGRRANYIYGAAKAGLATLVEGIAHRFGNSGPRAVIVKPGPVITPMTEGFANRRGLLWATPGTVAAVVRRAAARGGPVVYAPWFWRWIMLVIRLLPASVFNRLDL